MIISTLIVVLVILLGFLVTKKVERHMIQSEMMIILKEKDRFTEDKLIEMIVGLNFKFPEIVLAQSILESSNFTSNIFIENNNLFGMKEATQRITTSTGSQLGHAYYQTWRDSVIDYALFYATYMSKISSQEDYFDFLAQYYATDPDYVKKLKNIIVSKNLKQYFK